MPAYNIDVYLEMLDSNNDKVSSWAEQVAPGKARCKVCGGNSINFQMGKGSFIRHSESEKHKNNMKNLNSSKKQRTIQEAMAGKDNNVKQQEKLKANIKKFEIDLTRRLVSHNVSLGVTDCLTDCLKSHLSEESAIVKGMKLSSSKAEYLEKNGIAATYEEETIEKLHNCDGFSVGFDESEINKEHECEVMVKIATKDVGIELCHYKTIALEATDAETISESLLGEFNEDKVDYRKKCISPMTDGCNTMQGHLSGVKVRLAQKIPQMVDFGSCNDHHIGNAEGAGTEQFDEDVKEALVHTYFDIGGAKGKGLKRKKEFEELAKKIGIKLKALRKFGSTRFRSYRICAAPILHNWHAMVRYYSSVRNPTARQVMLNTFILDGF
jgi:hypothetical protein